MALSNQSGEVHKVLIVDDEAGVLNAMSRLLHDETYEILTATGGEYALELLQKNGPVQLIISDYRMPGMTGVEFLQQVMQRSPDTRRVILSGFPDSDVLLAALNEGRVHRFLVKPWNNDAIKAVITEMLDEYEMLATFRRNAEQLAHNNRLLARTNEHLSAILSEVLATMRRETAGEETPSVHHQSNHPSQLRSGENLSSREREILHALAAGRSLKAIAMDLGLSIKTVSTYKKRLFDKMGFKNSAELIIFGLKNSFPPTSHL